MLLLSSILMFGQVLLIFGLMFYYFYVKNQKNKTRLILLTQEIEREDSLEVKENKNETRS